MKKLLLAAAMIVGATAAASAADMRMPTKAPVMMAPAFSWSGFYLGGHAGYAWTNDIASQYTGNADVNALIAGGALPRSYDVSGDGFAGGLQFGFNWQAGALVFGLEADISGWDVGASALSRNVNPAAIPLPVDGTMFLDGNQWDSSASFSSDWVATLRGRLGLAMDRWMIFATGGVAVADINLDGRISQSFPVGGPNFRNWVGGTSGTEVGYVIGGGLEYAMTNNWLVRVEGLYYDFGEVTHTLLPLATNFLAPGNGSFSPAIVSTDVNMFVVRGALSYKF